MLEHAQTTYLEAQITTATPQKLRLMLIEGALRFASTAKEAWSDPMPYSVLENLRRCHRVLAELYAVVRKDDSEVAKQTADLYLFLYREVLHVLTENDRDRLDDVIDVLEIERGTWQAVCDQMPEAPIAEEGCDRSGTSEITVDHSETVEGSTYGAPVAPPESIAGESFSLDA